MSNAVARRSGSLREPPVQELADLDAAVLGAGLPLAAEMCITQAGLMRQDVDAAQALLEQAYALAPRHPATLIALYRFHFYGNRLERRARSGGAGFSSGGGFAELASALARNRASRVFPEFTTFTAFLSVHLKRPGLFKPASG